MTTAEHPLPAQPHAKAARKAEGFATPKEDKKPQCARFLPKRVLPIVFLPGIMGSNLKLSPERQAMLRRSNNIAWRPDILDATNIDDASNETPRERQLRLDPLQTSVDIYDPTGKADVSGDARHTNVELNEKYASPTLMDDPPTVKNGRRGKQKARARGWSEVLFKSYGELLQMLEARLNNTFNDGKLQMEWRDVVGIDPALWQCTPSLPQKELTEDELKAVVTGCWFAVYALGYNWLQSNGVSAKIVAARIEKIISDLNVSGYECQKVIIVTHSMGGLVGRALIHPDYGNLKEKVLGVVHGVMPAIGAPAAYRRIRAGFEDPGLMHNAKGSLTAKVAGNRGTEVTAVLANAPGGLELLPSEAYGNGWLKVTHNDQCLDSWPKTGDPYAEIYKVKGRWYSLLRENWINPCGLSTDEGGGDFARTCAYLDQAKYFHRQINQTFHPNSYAHYGADTQRSSFAEVVWDISKECKDLKGWHDWPIISDSEQGKLEVARRELPITPNPYAATMARTVKASVYATLLPPDAPGDQTVPARSADHQLRSGQFKAIFRQTGYEHQSSFQDRKAIASTLYCIIRIAQQAHWASEK